MRIPSSLKSNPTAFSDMMYGDNPEPQQQMNYAYVRQLTLPNTVLADNQGIWHMICQARWRRDPAEILPRLRLIGVSAYLLRMRTGTPPQRRASRPCEFKVRVPRFSIEPVGSNFVD